MIAVTMVLPSAWSGSASESFRTSLRWTELGHALAAPSALTESTKQISTDRMVCYELAAFVP
jgi:hypothetical protein